jgi:uncharacterized membrane protein YdfJ with MMPL/SSD domain
MVVAVVATGIAHVSMDLVERPIRRRSASADRRGNQRAVGFALGGTLILGFVIVPTILNSDISQIRSVQRLRAEVFPTVLDASPATAHVGGTTANFGDVAGRVSDRIPAFIGAVIALSFLLLMLVVRSVLVPLKAALLNLLSIGASYGVLVAVFQWGGART